MALGSSASFQVLWKITLPHQLSPACSSSGHSYDSLVVNILKFILSRPLFAYDQAQGVSIIANAPVLFTRPSDHAFVDALADDSVVDSSSTHSRSAYIELGSTDQRVEVRAGCHLVCTRFDLGTVLSRSVLL
jgi:hypothetical protein